MAACSTNKVLVKFPVGKRRYRDWSDCCILSIVFWLDRGRANRINVYISHKFCYRMLATCPTLMSRSDVTLSCPEAVHILPNGLKKPCHFSFVTMLIKSQFYIFTTQAHICTPRVQSSCFNNFPKRLNITVVILQ